MHALGRLRRKMWERSIVLILALSLQGCGANWTFSRSGQCTVIHKRWRANPLAVRTEDIDTVDEIREWFPPPTYTGVTLLTTAALSELAVERVSLVPDSVEALTGKCVETAKSRQACWVQDAVLKKSGFSLVLVAPVAENPDRLLSAAADYWREASACER